MQYTTSCTVFVYLNRMQRFIAIAIVILSAPFALSNADSLKQAANQHLAAADSIELGKTYFNLAKHYYYDYNDSLALHYIDQTLQVFTALHDTVQMSIINLRYADFISAMGDNESAIEKYVQAEQLARAIQKEDVLHSVLNNLGLTYKDVGKYELALTALYESLAIKEKVGAPKKNRSSTLLNIGLILDLLEKPDEAVTFYQRSIVLKRSIGDSIGVARVLGNIAVIEKNRNRYDKAIALIKQVIAILATENDDDLLYVSYTNIGNIYKNQGNIPAGLHYLELALEMAVKVNDANKMGDGYQNLAVLYHETGNIDKGIEYLERALQLTDYTQSLVQKYETYGKLYEAYAAKGIADEALHYLELSNQYRDSIYKMEQVKAMEEVQVKYETERKDKELAQNKAELAEEQLKAEQRNKLLIGALLGIALLMVLVVFIVRQQKQKRSRLLQEAQLGIQTERLRISRDLHDHLGAELTLVATSLDNKAYQTTNEKDKQELEAMGNNTRMAIAQLRETIWAIREDNNTLDALMARLQEYAYKLEAAANIALKVNMQPSAIAFTPARVLSLYRACQEALQNALKHAACSEITVDAVVQNDVVTITISDNGKGFDASTIKHGYGLHNMQERMQEIGGSYACTSTPGNGTKVTLELPV